MGVNFATTAVSTLASTVQAGVEIMKDVKQWEKQEAERKAKAMEQVLRFKSMRESQVQEKEARRQKVRDCSPKATAACIPCLDFLGVTPTVGNHAVD